MPLQPAEFRHSMRGTMNAIKLCVSAFDMPLERAEKLEFLNDVVNSAEKIVALLDQWDAETALGTADEESAHSPL
jgi:hypothetical protein